MCKIILFIIIHLRNQVTKLFVALCHYLELDPVETPNTKTSTAFLKKGKYLKKERFFVNLYDLMSKFIFSELKLFLAKLLSIRLISILSIYRQSFRGMN